MQTLDYLDEFISELKIQLKQDEVRHGDTWLKRPKKGQGDRIYDRIWEYYNDERLAKALAGADGKPVFVDSLPWLKIAGLALIGWIREGYPQEFPDH